MGTCKQTNLRNMLTVYDYVARHPGCTPDDIAAVLPMVVSTVRDWLKRLRAAGFIRTQGGNCLRGSVRERTYYFVSLEAGRPTELVGQSRQFKYSEKIKHAGQYKEFHRVLTKAKQVGMARDPLVAALFGSARAEVQA